jgi:hypothetical protein
MKLTLEELLFVNQTLSFIYGEAKHYNRTEWLEKNEEVLTSANQKVTEAINEMKEG